MGGPQIEGVQAHGAIRDEEAGFQACLIIEDWGNPYYHLPQDSVDTPGYLDYAYAVRMTLSGPGGQQGVRRALKALFSAHPMTFSGYGNPYQPRWWNDLD